MSFILDALKKSEEKRQKDELPTARKRILVLGGPGPRRWPLWLIIALLPTTLLTGWWLGRMPVSPVSQETEQVSQAAKIEPSPSILHETPPPHVSNTRPVAASGQPLPAKRETSSSKAVSAVATEPKVSPSAAIEPAPVPAPVPAPIPAEKQSRRGDAARSVERQPHQTTATENNGPASLPTYNELSRELKGHLPRLNITLHFYSTDPARRMVRIDNQLFHEGETISEGLILREITESATILDYQGFRFELESPGR